MRKSFVVTGGGGFIGSHLVDALLHLSKDLVERVIVIDDWSNCPSWENLERHRTDSRLKLINESINFIQVGIKGIDGIFHLAANKISKCKENPEFAMDNIRGTKNILDICRAHGARLVYSSSASVYGQGANLKEINYLDNKTMYGASKLAGEQMLRAYIKDYGIHGVSLRYMNVYGPRQGYSGVYTAIIPAAIRSLMLDKPVEINGDGQATYDFIHVSDVVYANLIAMWMSHQLSMEINVGTGIGTTINTLVDKIAHIMGKNCMRFHHRANQDSIVKFRIGNVDKMESELGILPLCLEKGLRDTVFWYMRKFRQEDKNV